MFAQSKGGNYSLTNGASGVADAIDFDGATDYLSRSSDLVGNADGKTFTFSAWVWWDELDADHSYAYILRANNGATGGGAELYFGFDISGKLTINLSNAAGGIIESVSASITVSGKTWSHVLVSMDLSNAANRHIYINNVADTGATWWTYSNDTIDWTRVGGYSIGIKNAGNPWRTRIAHVHLDYTYRDLSVESNRRLFITADRKPAANQAALNPILYLPMADPTQPGKNLGTGGDFALNGVVARSGRGPSQFNAPYSDLDGAADYLSRTTAPTGIADGKVFTCSLSFNSDSIAGGRHLICFRSNPGTLFFEVYLDGRVIQVIARNSAGSGILFAEPIVGRVVSPRNYHVVMAFDMDNQSGCKMVVNGEEWALGYTWFTTGQAINFLVDSAPGYYIGSAGAGNYTDGRLGNVFFDTKCIDLSNPDNLAKFVTGTGIDAKPADLGANGEKPFGTPPLIYLPMYGNNAGKNYGTGGDFTVNSGPFSGARGPNEYWGNKADFNGTTGALTNVSPVGLPSSTTTYSLSFFAELDSLSGYRAVCRIPGNGGNWTLNLSFDTGSGMLVGTSFAGVGITTSSTSCTTGTIYHFLICVDCTNTGLCKLYMNGSPISATFTTNASAMNLTNDSFAVGHNNNGSYFNGKLSEFYFTTDYIDFSQEANRLKFRDAFGNPVDLAPQIAAGTLPNPAIYMRFDPANFGKNSGTGGDFTVSGTITDGGQL